MIAAAWVATGTHGLYVSQDWTEPVAPPAGWTASGWRRALAEGARRVRAHRRSGDRRGVVTITHAGRSWLVAVHGRVGLPRLLGVLLSTG